ncbi:hypothetical protein EF888_06920 [Silicimonas algicola]|uniref:hypothetical protein n=1 Tax=Silicimonas algicola TaxID=1826607 RepID=UPI000F856046|nr:hypothetical protein [Silicimonas algicola]AZQ66894.1 hypothetical protein EF888_06920 [Silicimonas algicola]
MKTPAQAGSNLSKRPEVAARIKYLRFKHAEELSAIDADEPFAGFEQSILDVLGCMDELVELCVHHGLYADASQIRSGILTSTTRTLTHIEAIKALDRSAGVIVDDEMTDVAVRVLTTRCACE